MDIIISGHEFFYDITSISMLFFPGEKTNFVLKSKESCYIISKLVNDGTKQLSITKFKYNNKWYSAQKTADIYEDSKDLVKLSFYKCCSKATGIESDWGILTGIRPLSVYTKISESKKDPDLILEKRYLLKKEKIGILKNIYNIQKDIAIYNKNDVSVYISIPFCPSKCSYCSFISISAVNKDKLKNEYIYLLIKEIQLKATLIKKYNLNVRSLYVGGGTPGVLDAGELHKLFKALSKSFDLNLIGEKCFEIGRPDTVSEEKLAIIKKYGFDRICINTQTTNTDVLQSVNRKHTSKEYFDAVTLAKQYCFNSINTDLIAGLPAESFDSFKNSVNEVISCGVDNITVHTLSIKRSSALSQSDEYYNPQNDTVDNMIDYAYHTLCKNGYVPYYIYRQKNCVSNGENIGFCKIEKPCLYNIYMMEDIHSVIACGAGASSKIIEGKTVNRVINVKYPMDYVSDFNKIKNNTNKVENILKELF